MIIIYNDDFEVFRGETLEYIHNKNKDLIERWCEKCGVTSPVGYYNDLGNGVMTIYTEHPGWLIGMQGVKLDAFVKELEQEFNRVYKVEFVEVRGGFVNLSSVHCN